MNGAQEVAGFRALDDAVVVGRGQGDQLADTQFGDAFRAGALEFGRVLHRADADDRSLAGHQPRHRVHGADGAGVGQRNRHAGKVFGGELAVAGSPDDVFVGRDELRETHGFATLDGRDDQCPLAVLALQVDGETEVDVSGRDRGGLAVDLGVVPVHVREGLERLHQRVAQEVGERNLAAAGAFELIVDHHAVVDHQLGGDGPHAGRGRKVQRHRHVLHDRGGRTTQHLDLVAVAGRRAGRFGSGRRCAGAHRCRTRTVPRVLRAAREWARERCGGAGAGAAGFTAAGASTGGSGL